MSADVSARALPDLKGKRVAIVEGYSYGDIIDTGGPVWTRLVVGSTPLLTRELYFVIKRSRPDAISIIERFNAQLRGMLAEGTYHRLLHVDWIRADVDGDGDGVPEYVPRDDRAGPSEPQRVYTLFSAAPLTSEPPGFYVGGNIYGDWASVPENYKVSNSDKPDPRRSTATVFRFTW